MNEKKIASVIHHDDMDFTRYEDGTFLFTFEFPISRGSREQQDFLAYAESQMDEGQA